MEVETTQEEHAYWVVDLGRHIWNGLCSEITPVDAKGINGLLILSTAILGIAQYLDNEHSKFFKNAKSEIEKTTLPSPDEFSNEEAKEICRSLRKQQDGLRNTKPISLKWLIRILLFLLPYYACMYTGLYTCPNNTTWIQLCFKIGAIGVVLLAFSLLIWIRNASKARKKYTKELDAYMQFARPLNSLLENAPKKTNHEARNTTHAAGWQIS